ncbi:MAG: isoprenoid biosynthesis glyoxalase ElbB [Phycisphaeraceae bacterium]|nr:isoprenoid biosynthesis glyoxalase ElbB [Phycisphaeraceae bacterium]
MTKVAVVLSGCGVFDGSEIHEAVSVLTHLSRHGARVQCFAPDTQLDEIDHLAQKPTGHKRSVLVESARIARGDIKPLDQLKSKQFDAVVFPGGFGAAKNLCDFATKGPDCTVNPQVKRVINEFHEEGKPIALCCIAPVIAAKVLGKASGGLGCAVTIGSDKATASAIAKMGSTNIDHDVTAAHCDDDNNIITTPAYMCDAKIHEVYEGIGRMIEQTLERVASGAGVAK